MFKEPVFKARHSRSGKAVLPAIVLIIVMQILFLMAMIANRQSILSSDIIVVLETRPIDPRSLFRGDYVRLKYDINNLQLDELSGDRTFKINDTVYVVLEQNGPFWDAQGIYLQRPVLPESPANSPKKRRHVIRGVIKTVNNRHWSRDDKTVVDVTSLRVSYGIENYFVPEGEGLKLERPEPGDKVTLEVALDKDGRAAIKTLLLNGVAQYQEALF
ncbi:MAG: GDYXXLXY domain-containing protein [Gammaproteobacteria bacterium]|nr:GDYXXLXY domain-containing protein [Gammaproteobacteria bacterium]